MILVWLIVLLLGGGLLAWFAERWHPRWCRWVSLAALSIDLMLAVALWAKHGGALDVSAQGPWLAQVDLPWIPHFGIHFLLAVDGLSLLLVLLTLFLGVMSVATSWTEIRTRVGFFHFNLLWTLAGTIGVFLALDLFLFAFFWEVMLVPMYFLIAIWGHENRVYAAIKFFIFTQASGLLMLVAILALVLVHRSSTGVLTFSYFDLLGTPMRLETARWIMLGFLAAFLVKLPAFPFHTWLPDAHTEAPTAGSVILAGVLLKTGAYGLLRFVLPLFPDAALRFTPVAMGIAVIGILYGAILAFAQSDLKRLVAYTSVSHLGFVLLGVFAWNAFALQGVVMQMLAHGVSTAALFMLVGALQERIHTRDMAHMGGLWASAPRMAAIGLFFAIASLGMPGLGNFVGEFLVLLGAYRVEVTFTVIAAVGLITATVYALALVQKTFHGQAQRKIVDLSVRDMATLVAMMAVTVWLGLYPQNVLDAAQPAIAGLQHIAVQATPSRGDQ
jgi:NADH-quinone oxidoreductase subunit M